MLTYLLIIISAILSFLMTKWIIKYFFNSGIIAEDVHKEPKKILPTSGGIAVFLAFFMASMAATAFLTYFRGYKNIAEIYAGVMAISFATFIGFLDDINVKGAKRIGLKQWQKPILTLFASLPIMSLNINRTFESLSFVPPYLYSIIVAPLGFVGATNMVNMLAGFNGLEAGIGIIILSTLLLHNPTDIAAKIIIASALGTLIGFWFLNKYPAKILPGDSLTYYIGSVIGIAAILGNLEKTAVILSIPFFIEFLLKLRGKFKKPTVGYIKNGKIYKKTEKIYSIPHLFMNGKFNEPQIVLIIYGIFLLLSLFTFII